MALFIMLFVLVLLGVILLAPLMLPGALVVFVALGLAKVFRRPHADQTVRSF
ncbi:MAG: hypothetical protein ACLQK4_17435 [Acidimicrobiales bacterium]|jgi:hypothetical protein